MKLNIVTDYHLGASNALGSLKDFLDELKKYISLYSIGDNFDFANMKKKHIEGYKIHYETLKKVFVHIDGNHERVSKTNDTIKINGVLLAHGDFEFWGEEKAVAYRSEPQGAGLFKRAIIVNAIESFERFRTAKIEEDFLNRASTLAKLNGCHTYICGHKHPDKRIETKYNGIRIIVLERGFSEVEV